MLVILIPSSTEGVVGTEPSEFDLYGVTSTKARCGEHKNIWKLF
jgi:hypothetical protein